MWEKDPFSGGAVCTLAFFSSPSLPYTPFPLQIHFVHCYTVYSSPVGIGGGGVCVCVLFGLCMHRTERETENLHTFQGNVLQANEGVRVCLYCYGENESGWIMSLPLQWTMKHQSFHIFLQVITITELDKQVWLVNNACFDPCSHLWPAGLKIWEVLKDLRGFW